MVGEEPESGYCSGFLMVFAPRSCALRRNFIIKCSGLVIYGIDHVVVQ